MEQVKLVKPSRAIGIVVSNMIGTGVYTSLGFQAMGIDSVFALIFIWITGGIVALCGALTYGELAARIPQSGGEYIFLSRIFHPAFGFLSGFISMTIGFAAPMAIAAIALGKYLGMLLNIPALILDLGFYSMDVAPMIIPVSVIVILTLLNISSFKVGTNFNALTSLINVLLIVTFCIFGLAHGAHPGFSFTVTGRDWGQVLSPEFAVSLVYVSFAYSGWNSAAYITHQVKDPRKNLPRILIAGTLIVMVLYGFLNFIFLYTVPVSELSGKLEVALVAAQAIFGTVGGKLVAVLISIGLLASINSLLIFGPRVSQAITLDYKKIAGFGRENKYGVPVWCVFLMSMIALVLIWTATFEQVMTIIGFTLGIFTTTSVAGVFILRYRMKKNGEPYYHTFGYPIVPILFILIEGCMMIYVFIEKMIPSLVGIGITLSGLIFYFILKNSTKNAQ